MKNISKKSKDKLLDCLEDAADLASCEEVKSLHLRGTAKLKAKCEKLAKELIDLQEK